MGVCCSSLTSEGVRPALLNMAVRMKVYIFLLIACLVNTNNASPATRKTGGDECKKVPKVELKEECRTEEVRMEQSYLVQECEDVFITDCEDKEEDNSEQDVVSTTEKVTDAVNDDNKQSFSNFPARTFSSFPVKHSLNKREDVTPETTEESEVEKCIQRKIKHCQNMPQWKTMRNEICEKKNITVYVDECDSNSETEEISTMSVDQDVSLIAEESDLGVSGYLAIILPSLLLLIAAVFLALWLLSLWLGISFLAAIKHVLEPLQKGLSYAKFT